MRIISGKYKGHRLVAPKNLPVRPTTDLSKESLFNILNNYFHFYEITVLDLFAGTGNISYEFASRGTKQITAIDLDYKCIQYIKSTSDKLMININAVKSDVYKYIARSQSQYDVIFADPPYDFSQQQFETIVEQVFHNNLLSEEGLLIVEHSTHTSLEHLPHFSFSRKYGSSIFSFFEYPTQEEEDQEETQD